MSEVLDQEIMKYTTVKISEILKHPTKRMDAKYWIKKKLKKNKKSLKPQASSYKLRGGPAHFQAPPWGGGGELAQSSSPPGVGPPVFKPPTTYGCNFIYSPAPTPTTCQVYKILWEKSSNKLLQNVTCNIW